MLGTVLSLCLPAVLFAGSNTPTPEHPFSVAELFFELNDSAHDLGLHGRIGADDWKQLTILAPGDRVLMQLVSRGGLRRQGMSELAFESAEPPFSELPPTEFLQRFPAGTYELEGTMLDGTELDSEVQISHVIPAGAVLVSPQMANCTAPIAATTPVTLRWQAVNTSHASVGISGQPVQVQQYEVALQRLDGTGAHLFFELPPTVTSLPVPSWFTATPGVYKFEVLVKATNGNRTGEESCFRLF
jgi:hypothetical protein